MASDDETLPSSVDAGTTTGGRIGRFVGLEMLGQGGMGMVLAAYDPDLDRKVALKLLRPTLAPSIEATERLLREARAMARLSHPNVLTVHEVGLLDGQSFIAMEFAAGGTLRDWCAAEVRSWRDILDHFVLAGRGLAAAHQIGMTHRDFKPENVLLTRDGEVRVADFGLVSIHGLDDERGAALPPSPSGAEADLTRTGELLGTPAYMAPEQHLRGEVGPAADQFAFCVSLWEALFGARPFVGRDHDELVRQVADGAFVEPAPGAHDVPGWLREVVRRGLRSEPAARWPSMTALLDALGRDPVAARRGRLRRVAVAGAGIGLVAVAIFGLTRSGGVADTRCQGMERRLDGVWDAPRAAAVRRSLEATGVSYAADTYQRVAAGLDAYTRDWVAARVDTCQATHARGEQSEARLDLRMACLDRRLLAVDSLVAVFARGASSDVVARAAKATAQLPSLDGCDDVTALTAVVPPPGDPATLAAVEQVRRRLAEADALEQTGQFRDGLTIAQQAVGDAEGLAYPPLLAEALWSRATLEERVGDAAVAEQTFERALLAAADARDDVLAAKICSDLVFVVGHKQHRLEDAPQLRARAEVAMRRAGGAPAAEARLSNSMGLMLTSAGDYAEARRYLERAIALWEQVRGPDDVQTGTALNNLGNVYQETGDYPQAAAYLGRALDIRTKQLGPDHPDVAMSHNNLGNAYLAMGDHRQARRHLELAVAGWEQALGAEHPDVAMAHNNLGAALVASGDLAGARLHNQRALDIFVAALGPDHHDVYYPLNGLGELAFLEGDLAAARAYQTRALAVLTGSLGPDHPQLDGVLHDLGDVALAEGKAEEARQLQARAVAVLERGSGPNHPDLAVSLGGLAEALLAQGRRAEALVAIDRAIAIAGGTGGDAKHLAHCQQLRLRAVP